MTRFAAVEGGGTSWTAAIAVDQPDNIVDTINVVTETPEITLGKLRQWLNERQFDAIGVASFGPIDAKVGSPTYGYITSTPKPNWADTDVLRLLGIYDEFAGIPFDFDTDVNAPALAEYILNKKPGMTSSSYITVGTGVGVGLVVNGATVKGLVHPEGGHMLVQPCGRDTFEGSCPYHGRCVEGMCSSGALCKRLNCDITDLPGLPDDHEVWDTFSYYIAQLCCNLVLIVSPERIVIGGGILNRASLYDKIRAHTIKLLNDYIKSPMLKKESVEQLIGRSIWGSRAGLIGAVYLSSQAYTNAQK